MTTTKRNPIRKRPLRRAGQSLQEQVLEEFFESAGPWYLIPIVLLIWALVEWLQLLLDVPSLAIPMTALAMLSIPVAYWRIRSVRRSLQPKRMGRDGEVAVGEALEEVKRYGYQVFHDIVIRDGGQPFNIDHVVVGSGGVFAIETKTRSKSGGREETVVYDGEKIVAGTSDLGLDPIHQVEASARRVATILRELSGTNEEVAVRKVLLFPGWYVSSVPKRYKRDDLWILNENAFVKWLRNERPRLNSEQIAAYANRLSEYVRRGDAVASR